MGAPAGHEQRGRRAAAQGGAGRGHCTTARPAGFEKPLRGAGRLRPARGRFFWLMGRLSQATTPRSSWVCSYNEAIITKLAKQNKTKTKK